MALRDDLQSRLGTAYSLERELGGGGMSRVFVAEDEQLHRKVVVKVLSPDLAAGVSASRFQREIQLVATLQHANIVPLLSAGDANGLPYYMMPFVDGRSLAERIAERGAMGVMEIVGVLRDVTRALAYAHERGVVHRDIKPANILLSGDAAVVTDFGIAKALAAAKGDRDTADTLTSVGMSLGTPAYMSPEQASGDPATDYRTDFYALGCVAYEMLAGAPPFTARSVHQLIAAHMTESPQPIGAKRADCPASLAALVMRCLEKNPDGRPASAREILRALDDTGPLSSHSARSRRRWIVPAIAAAVVMVFAGAGIWYTRSRADTSVHSIAVLPFENIGGDSTQEYFSDGIADDLSSALAQVPGVRVAARSSANAFRGKQDDPRAMGAKLRVAALIEGSVRHLGSRIRVHAELVNVNDGLSLWSKTYEHDASDAPKLAGEITNGITGALRVGGSTETNSKRTTDSAAYDLFLRARYFAARGASRNDFEKARDYYRRAIERDPSFAAAYAGMAWVYTQLADAYVPPNEAYPKAKAAAQRAIELDSTLAEGHSQLAAVLEQYDLDWPGTKREIDRALALNPSDATAMVDLAVYNLVIQNRAASIDAALQYARLDPLSAFAHAFGAYLLGLADAPDSAISQYRQAQDIQAGFVYVAPFVDDAYRAKGMLTQALEVNEQASRTLGHVTPGTVLTLIAMNRRAEAVVKLQDVVRAADKGALIPPEDIARCYAALGDNEKALEYLRKGVDAHSSFAPAGRLYPELATVTKDPRYLELMREKLHLR